MKLRLRVRSCSRCAAFWALKMHHGGILDEVHAALVALPTVRLHVLARRTGVAERSVAARAELRRFGVILLAFRTLHKSADDSSLLPVLWPTFPVHALGLGNRGTGWAAPQRIGGREGIRTLDLSVANAALSQLSYAPLPERISI